MDVCSKCYYSYFGYIFLKEKKEFQSTFVEDEKITVLADKFGLAVPLYLCVGITVIGAILALLVKEIAPCKIKQYGTAKQIVE